MNAAAVRRQRQVKRRVGSPPNRLITVVVAHGDELFFHFRKRLPIVMQVNATKHRALIDSEMARGGFIKQKDQPVWVNKRATLEDLCAVADMKVVGARRLEVKLTSREGV